MYCRYPYSHQFFLVKKNNLDIHNDILHFYHSCVCGSSLHISSIDFWTRSYYQLNRSLINLALWFWVVEVRMLCSGSLLTSALSLYTYIFSFTRHNDKNQSIKSMVLQSVSSHLVTAQQQSSMLRLSSWNLTSDLLDNFSLRSRDPMIRCTVTWPGPGVYLKSVSHIAGGSCCFTQWGFVHWTFV